MTILEQYIEETEDLKSNKRGLNAKKNTLLEKAKSIKQAIEADISGQLYSSDFKIFHQHTSDVKSVAFSADSSYLITTSVDATSVWKLIKDGANLMVTIPATE